MVDLIDITSNILAQNYICFEEKNINTNIIPIPIEEAKFGILNFKAVTTSETKSNLDFLFIIDCSGSMSDRCSDGRSKMQHIIHTLKNMIIFFNEHPNTNIFITVNAFDTQIYNIIQRTKISEQNIGKIISKIEKVIPRGSTNIEFALRESANKIAELKELYPNNIINHIFMTDGEATDGSQDISFLQSIVEPNIFNAFIGFGIDHDSTLLNGISSVGKSAYYFIDKLESAGLIYGEILHGIIYKLLIEVDIIIENGFIYDFKTNMWVKTLSIGDIVSEANKTFNIISSNPNECKVSIKGKMDDLQILFPSSLIESTDLTSHIYRQRTLQILYEVNDFCKRNREYEGYYNLNPIISMRNFRDNQANQKKFKEEQKLFKIKLANFIEEIKKYMSDNDLGNDKILKNLCDDIYICYRTLGTKYGGMFCTARQTSQGTQRLYTASNTADIDIDTENLYDNRSTGIANRVIPSIPRLQRRSNNIQLFNDDYFDNINHEVSDFADTPYLTPQATQVMREISRTDANANIYDDEDDDNLSTITENMF